MRKSIEELTQLAIMVRMRLLGNYPLPGDAVRLIGNYPGVGESPGAIGIIGGVVGKPRENYDITFNASAFRGKSSRIGPGPEYVSCSGGPGTIATPAWKLVPTNGKVLVTFWRWRNYPGKGNGESFHLFVPVFHWDGKNK